MSGSTKQVSRRFSEWFSSGDEQLAEEILSPRRGQPARICGAAVLSLVSVHFIPRSVCTWHRLTT